MLVGSTLFSLIVNAGVYVIDAVTEETSLVAAVPALHHVVVVALLVALPMLMHCRRPARSSLSALRCVRCAPWPLSRAAARSSPITNCTDL